MYIWKDTALNFKGFFLKCLNAFSLLKLSYFFVPFFSAVKYTPSHLVKCCDPGLSLCPVSAVNDCPCLCCSSQKQSLELTSDLSILQMTRKELENQVGSLKEQHLRDSADLKTLLSKAENQAKDVQKEVKRKDMLSPIMVGLKAKGKSDIHAT